MKMKLPLPVPSTKNPWPRFWLHCDRVLVDGKKMDETAGGLPVRSLIDAGWTGREIRFWLLSSHYRKPVLLSDERLGDARRTLRRLDGCMTALQQLEGGLPYPELDQLLYDLKSGFGSAMEDDLNISVALAAIFTAIKQLNRLMTAGRIAADQVPKVMDGFRQLDTVLQIFDFKASDEDPVVADLQRRREAARRARDWDLADALRQQLSDLGGGGSGWQSVTPVLLTINREARIDDCLHAVYLSVARSTGRDYRRLGASDPPRAGPELVPPTCVTLPIVGCLN
jgi:cysteinyl-tRNA synthetase